MKWIVQHALPLVRVLLSKCKHTCVQAAVLCHVLYRTAQLWRFVVSFVLVLNNVNIVTVTTRLVLHVGNGRSEHVWLEAGGFGGPQAPNGHEPEDLTLASAFNKKVSNQEMRSGQLNTSTQAAIAWSVLVTCMHISDSGPTFQSTFWWISPQLVSTACVNSL